jgi:hypothetical protein
MCKSRHKEGITTITFKMLDKRNNDNLTAKGYSGVKRYPEIINTRASVTITRPDIAAGLPIGSQVSFTFCKQHLRRHSLS